jgi:hypothetical protein
MVDRAEKSHRIRRGTCLSLAVAAALVICALAGPRLGGNPGTAVAAIRAPCTKQALARGLKHGETPFPGGRIEEPWNCAGRFAYAAVIYRGEELTILFRAVGRRWKTADRSRYCDSVPARIWQTACNTN